MGRPSAKSASWQVWRGTVLPVWKRCCWHHFSCPLPSTNTMFSPPSHTTVIPLPQNCNSNRETKHILSCTSNKFCHTDIQSNDCHCSLPLHTPLGLRLRVRATCYQCDSSQGPVRFLPRLQEFVTLTRTWMLF